jgi:hypothetical protein
LHHLVNTRKDYAWTDRQQEERSGTAATLSPDRKEGGAEVVEGDGDGLYFAYHQQQQD